MKEFYPLADRFPNISNKEQSYLKAIYTGEKRKPKKGEWYLSGAIIQAWQAFSDLNMVFCIAKIVKVETKIKIVEYLN